MVNQGKVGQSIKKCYICNKVQGLTDVSKVCDTKRFDQGSIIVSMQKEKNGYQALHALFFIRKLDEFLVIAS